jgi:hypothetical protein
MSGILLTLASKSRRYSRKYQRTLDLDSPFPLAVKGCFELIAVVITSQMRSRPLLPVFSLLSATAVVIYIPLHTLVEITSFCASRGAVAKAGSASTKHIALLVLEYNHYGQSILRFVEARDTT